MKDELRSLRFKQRNHRRYWWFQQPNHDYVPPIFAVLSDQEWDLIAQWYDETDRRGVGGEVNIPALSLISGLIEGSGIRNIVQLGHAMGFSTLLLGFMMRRMGFQHSIFSVDINPGSTEFTRNWVHRAGLDPFVQLVVDSSEAAHLPQMARDYFSADIATLFVDSSHLYEHTLRELETWYPELQPLGFVLMHDASTLAARFDGGGGVLRALREWTATRRVSHLLMNEDVDVDHPPLAYGSPWSHLLKNEQVDIGPPSLVYGDPCGFAIIQKTNELRASPLHHT